MARLAMARPVARTACLTVFIAGPFVGLCGQRARRYLAHSWGAFPSARGLRAVASAPVSRAVTELPKTDVLSALFGVWDDIERLLDGLPGARWKKPVPLPA